jgi:hypothetical protein
VSRASSRSEARAEAVGVGSSALLGQFLRTNHVLSYAHERIVVFDEHCFHVLESVFWRLKVTS